MQHRQQHSTRRLGRAFALAALVALLCGQLLETQHQHAFHDPVADCLLCQTGSDKPAPTAVTSAGIAVQRVTYIDTAEQDPSHSTAYRSLARGPPLNA